MPAPHHPSLLLTAPHSPLGRIYCTTITAKLVQLKLRVPSTFLHPLPMDTPTDIEGVQVTLVDANHCPGAAMVVFEPRNRLPIVRIM